jgi:hypothetical protein
MVTDRPVAATIDGPNQGPVQVSATKVATTLSGTRVGNPRLPRMPVAECSMSKAQRTVGCSTKEGGL